MRDARRAKRLSQSALARRLRVTQATISRLERYDLTPSEDLLRRLVEALGVDGPEALGWRVELVEARVEKRSRVRRLGRGVAA